VKCKQKSLEEGKAAIGYTFQIDFTTPFFPTNETHWCEEEAGQDCRVRAIVHELAHSCGWDHHHGRGVPGNEGVIVCE
jgi:hypothetical protein